MMDAFHAFLKPGEEAGQRMFLCAPGAQTQGSIGHRLGNSPGSSMEFLDHRAYYPGDDVRRIDWSAFARSDKLTLKLFREEIAPHADILIDVSRSMALDGTRKQAALLGLSALLTQAAVNGDFTFSTWITADEGCRRIDNGGSRPVQWDDFDFVGTRSPTDSMKIRPPTWRPNGIRILLSDLLWLGDPLELLHTLSEKASAVIIIQILSDEDTRPLMGETVKLVDSENGETLDLFLDDRALENYCQSFNAHLENWRRASRQVGAMLTVTVAEEIVTHWQLSELVQLGLLQIR
jgi:uncharacterized protein (DUF58 family)